MKKMYLLFSLALCLFGVNVAYAKIVLGEQKTSFKAGDKLVFQGCGNINSGTDWEFGSWLYARSGETISDPVNLSRGGSEDLSSAHTGYLLELVDAKTSLEKNGETYKGYYLYCPGLGKYAAPNGSSYNFKKNIERAQVFYLINPKTYAIDFRGSETFETAYPGVQEVLTTAFNLVVREKADDDGNGKDGYNYYALNRNMGENVARASYVDWAAWWYIFEGEETGDGSGDAATELQTLLDEITPVISNGVVGTGIGCVVDADAFETLKSAYNEASQVAGTEDVEAQYTALVEAYEAFKAFGKDGFVPLTSGYYYIRSACDAISARLGYQVAIFTSGALMNWGEENQDSRNFMWQITETDVPNRYAIRNVGTLGYIRTDDTNYKHQGTQADSTACTVLLWNGRPKFTIQNGGRPLHASENDKDPSGKIVVWAANGEDSPSTWTFIPVEKFTAEELGGAMNQVVRNDEYADLLATAMNTYRIALGYLPYTAADNNLITYTPGEEEANNAVTYGEAGTWTGGTVKSNAKQTTEGSYGALCDGLTVQGSFFHSCWQNGPADWHYLQFDLDEPIENVAFYWTPRLGEGTPRRLSKIDVQVCSDTVNGGVWSTVATLNTDYLLGGDEMEINGKLVVGNDEVITPAASLFGSYKHIRMVAKEVMTRSVSNNAPVYTANSGMNNGYPFFTAGELNILKVESDPDCQMAALKNDKEIAPLIEALEAQISKALVTVDPTAEEMAELQQAYDDFVAVFPDPTPLTELIEKTQTYMGNMYVGGVPGTYESQDALDLNLLAVQQAIDEAQADIDGQTLFSKSQVEARMAAIEEARQALIDGARPIDFTKWVRLYLTREYWAKNPDIVLPSGWVENSAMYAPEDADSEVSYIKFDVFDADKGATAYDWRFIPVKGGYFIQNRATGKFIGESRAYESAHAWYPALSSVPAVFTVEPIGGGSFVIAGTTLDGGSVVEKAGYAAVHKYLHGAAAGQAVAYWESNDLGSRSGWEFEIQSADAFGDEADSEMENASVQKHLVPNRLYTGCYPMNVTIAPEEDVLSVYKVAGKNADESVIYLEQLEDVEGMVSIEAGTPVLYAVGPEGTDFTDYVQSEEEEASAAVVLYYDFYPTLDSEENDGMYVTEPSVEAGIVGLFEDQEVFKGHGLVSVYESGNAVVPYGLGFIEEDDETIETVMLRTTCYIAPSAARVLGADEVAGLKALPIAGKVDNAVAPVVGGDSSSALVDVYTIDGIRVRTGVSKAEALKGLKSGLYIVNKQKVVVD